MKRGQRAWRLPFVVLVVVVSMAIGIVRSRRPTFASPALVVRTHRAAAAAALAAADDADEDRAMALAVASIAPVERKRLLDLMRYTTARLEAKLSPLGTDFGDDGGSAVDEFRRSMVAHMPTFNAARAFAREAWSSPNLEVRVAASCHVPLADDEVCVAMWDASDATGNVARARFLAWAVTSAAVVDLGTREAAEACAHALRERTSAAGSPVAVVLLDDDLALQPIPEKDELKDAARLLGRAMAANHIEDTQHLEAFARAAPSGRVAGWLELSRASIVVVPRLSAIADPAALPREIEAAAGSAHVRWVRRP